MAHEQGDAIIGLPLSGPPHLPDPFLAITKAHLTLRSGCAFWARNTLPLAPSSRQAHLVAIRMNGNRLRELDRFTAILLDEIVALDRRRRGGLKGGKRPRSTSGKLVAVEMLLGFESFAHARLRAISRMSSSLRSGSAGSHAIRLSRDIRLAVGEDDGAQGHPAPNSPQLSHHAILAICQFYKSLGDSLLSAAMGDESRSCHEPDGPDRAS